MEQESEAGEALDAATNYLRETMHMYGLELDERAHALVKQKLDQHGFTSRADAVRFYQEGGSSLEEIVTLTCAQHSDSIIAELRSLATTSRALQEPSRYRKEGGSARDRRIDAQLRTAEESVSKKARREAPTDRLATVLKGTAIESIANPGEPLENGMDAIDSGHVCDFEVVWKELHRMYPGELTAETANALARIVLPHLFRAGARTITRLAQMEEVLYEMLLDIEQLVTDEKMEISCPTETAMRMRLGL